MTAAYEAWVTACRALADHTERCGACGVGRACDEGQRLNAAEVNARLALLDHDWVLP